MTEPSKERIAAALALAEAVDAAARACDLDGTPPELFQRTFLARCEALAAYRATAPKLRTRAEVDAEIVGAVRRHVELWPPEGPIDPYAAGERWRRIKTLCAEPTADPQPYGSSSDRVDSPPRVDAAAGAAYFDEDLIRRAIDPSVPPGHMRIITGRGAFDVLVEPDASGPHPTPATKESSDAAGVEAGAANAECAWCQDSSRPPLYKNRTPERIEWVCQKCLIERAANRITDHDADQRGVEACSCEESEALKDELKECRQLLDYARRCAQDIVTVLEEARK